MILLDSFRNVLRPYTLFYLHRDYCLNPNSNSVHRICGAKTYQNANSRLFSEQRNFFDTDKCYPVVLSDVMCINALICAKMCAGP